MGQLPKIGTLLIDVQDRLFPRVANCERLESKLITLINACKILDIPVVVTEQYPQGLGETIAPLKSAGIPMTKTAFSCLGDEAINKKILESNIDTWILAGIETHVCVLQTAKDLLVAGKVPIIALDAVSSRNLLDHETALAELRSASVRLTTIETILFELLGDSKHCHFKEISKLVK